MFSKISRYRKVPDVTAPDARGRMLAAKDLRLLPDVTGTFRHTVDGGDRLDQLAYKYYGQPLHWWNICDANPEFLSPLALLAKDPIVTARFPVTVASEPPPWADPVPYGERDVGRRGCRSNGGRRTGVATGHGRRPDGERDGRAVLACGAGHLQPGDRDGRSGGCDHRRGRISSRAIHPDRTSSGRRS